MQSFITTGQHTYDGKRFLHKSSVYFLDGKIKLGEMLNFVKHLQFSVDGRPRDCENRQSRDYSIGEYNRFL